MTYSRRLPKIIRKHVSQAQAELIEADGDEVRDYIVKNLMYGRMCMEVSPSDEAFGSLVSALKIAKLVAESNAWPDMVRVIDGCEMPLQNILRRRNAGEMRAIGTELATISAACSRVLADLPRMANPDLVCAYYLDKNYRQAAREASVPKSRAERRAEERRAK